jgi:hypothetical protein
MRNVRGEIGRCTQHATSEYDPRPLLCLSGWNMLSYCAGKKWETNTECCQKGWRKVRKRYRRCNNRKMNFFSIYLIHPALGFTQPLTEMNTRSRKIFVGSRALPVPRADNITATCESIVYTTFHYLIGLHSLLQGQLYFHIFIWIQTFSLYGATGDGLVCSRHVAVVTACNQHGDITQLRFFILFKYTQFIEKMNSTEVWK